MKKIIHNLRQKPEQTRRHIVHIFMVIVGAILVSLWIWSLGKTFSNPEVQTKMKQDLQPFTLLKDNIVNGYNSVTTEDYSEDFTVIE